MKSSPKGSAIANDLGGLGTEKTYVELQLDYTSGYILTRSDAFTLVDLLSRALLRQSNYNKPDKFVPMDSIAMKFITEQQLKEQKLAAALTPGDSS